MELYNNIAAGSIDGTELNLNLDTNQVQGLQVTIFIFITIINKMNLKKLNVKLRQSISNLVSTMDKVLSKMAV